MKLARILAPPTLAVAGLIFLAPQCAEPPVQTAGVPGIHVGSLVSWYQSVSGPGAAGQIEVVSVIGTWVKLRRGKGKEVSTYWVNFAHVTAYSAWEPAPESGK